MEEKKRFIPVEESGESIFAFDEADLIIDTEKDYVYGANNHYDFCDFLNQQDQRIKELEKQQETYTNFISYQFEENKLRYNKLNKELTKQVQELKHQLHDLPKKIIDDIKCYSFIDDIEYSNEPILYKMTENDLDTILKKYGGGNE